MSLVLVPLSNSCTPMHRTAPHHTTPQVDSDWWFLFELMRPLRRHGALKIILKDDQKHVPVTGWGMRGFGFIFLKRDWVKDRWAQGAGPPGLLSRHHSLKTSISPESRGGGGGLVYSGRI